MANYIKENYSAFDKILNILVDSSPADEWKSEEHKIEFKNLNLAGYRDFLYKLSDIEIKWLETIQMDHSYTMEEKFINYLYKKDWLYGPTLISKEEYVKMDVQYLHGCLEEGDHIRLE